MGCYRFAMPLILTIQLFTTENKDRIAWVNMFNDFLIFKDLDSNAIYSIVDQDKGGIPAISGSNEKVGSLEPMVMELYRNYTEYMDESGYTSIEHVRYPSDKTVSEIASTIKFSPPLTTSEANVTWGIEYPNLPTYASFWDGEHYFSNEMNSSYANSCPTDYSYTFDYNIGNNFTNLDITWELGKITNASLHNIVQGCGLVIPHYNYFLSTFDIDEIDAKELTLPCDLFAFESNDTIVAEINMGGQDKKNYMLYDFPVSGVNTELESKGGSVHPLVVAFDELNSHYEDPIINSIYALKDIVVQDPTFGIEDSLYRLEIQNYPLWSGERLRHDPTLTVYFEEYEVEEEETTNGGKKPFIPGYNYAFLIGAVGVITLIIVLERRKKKFKLT